MFGKGAVEMSEELDHKGADFRVTYRGKVLNYQVKKETQSREVRAEKKVKEQIEGEFVPLSYQVPNSDVFDNPKRRNGEWKLAYKRFKENNELKRLPNGFVVFTKAPFESKKLEIDSSLG